MVAPNPNKVCSEGIKTSQKQKKQKKMKHTRKVWVSATKNMLARMEGQDRIPITVKLKRSRNEPSREIHGLLVLPQVESVSESGVAVLPRKKGTYERYLEILKQVEDVLGTHALSREELNAFMHGKLGERFLGTFAAGEQWEVSNKQPYAIVNTTAAPGEHWLGVAKIKNSPRVLVYDSLGRVVKLVVGDRVETVSTRPGAEQDDQETNCGQRAAAWILLVDERGTRAAREI